MTLVPHERVQKRTAELIEDAPQSPAGVVEAVTSIPREQAQQRTAGEIGEVPKTASQDQRLQRTVEQACVDRAEIDEIALRKWLEGMCEQFGVHEVAKIIEAAGREEARVSF